MRRQNAANQAHEDHLMRTWVAEEDVFVLKQAKKKAAIRVRDGRGRPIDWLTVLLLDLFPEDDLLDEESYPSIPSFDPFSILQSLSGSALANLKREVDANATLERIPKLQQYWRNLSVLCSDRIVSADSDRSKRGLRTVAADIETLLTAKTMTELQALQRMIEAKVKSGEPIDVDYWQELLRSLGVKIAHNQLLLLCRAAWRRHQGSESSDDPSAEELLQATHLASPKPDGTILMIRREPSKELAPPLPKPSPLSSGTNHDSSASTNAMYEKELARGLNEDEEVFAAEEPLANSDPGISDKLKPRKPRYFNRVQMGYEWNKYNQTHYDHDNPPPKVVQGYRFNVFYPDLVDHTKAPTFRIIRENGRRRGQTVAPAGEEDTCIIRFVSSPPYQDLAFRVVDKEWDFSAKRDRGFRSSFDRGILQVHFQFKKIYYRK